MKKAFYISVFINISIIFFCGYKFIGSYYSTRNNKMIIKERTYMRDLVFKELTIDSNSTVFVGTSLTEGFPLSEMFNDVSFKNRGVGGALSDQVSNRCGWILKESPKKLIVEMGINDILAGMDEIQIIDNFKKITTQKNGYTKIYFCSILPTSMNHTKNNEIIYRTNLLIKNLCIESGVSFIDTYFKMVDKEGKLKEGYSLDGIHLTGLAYKSWKETLSNHIN